MFRNRFLLAGLFSLAIMLLFQGCTFQSDNCSIIDDSAPAAPRGVYSTSGDGEVLIKWYPNQEKDLDGYVIYRGSSSNGEYIEMGVVGSRVTSYVDDDVRNGNTYYYAVSAYDYDGNESELSPEIVEDTPRPDGRGVKLRDYIMTPELCGFDFAEPERGSQMYNWEKPNLYSNIDIYFGVDTEVSVPYIYSDNDTLIQDLGYTDSMNDVDVSPTRGFTTLFVEAIIGHTYAFLTPDGHYAKVRITDLYIDWIGNDIREAWIVFDWAYQLQIDNPDLAPKKLINKSIQR